MICWDRTDDLVIGTFLPVQVRWLRRQLSGFRDLIDWRMRQYRCGDLLHAFVGMPLPVAPPEEPMLRTLLARYVPEQEPEPVRLWREPDVLGRIRDGIEVVLGTLPETGGVVVLDALGKARDWACVLVDLRVAYAVKTGVVDALDVPPPAETPEHLETPYFHVGWLREVVDGLTEIAGFTVSG
jgi:hypothetical protein